MKLTNKQGKLDSYLKSAVLGASDGIVTTFAVVAGVVGAGFATDVIIVLGIANMVADGISMSAGDFLGELSILQMHNNGNFFTKKGLFARRYYFKKNMQKVDFSTSLVSFISFILAGFLPLLPYLAMIFGFDFLAEHQFLVSVISTLTAMFFVGSLRTIVIKGNWFKNGLEMLLIGSIASSAAYILGVVIERFLIK